MDEFWADWEEADDAPDESLAAVIDHHVSDHRYGKDPDSWLNALEARAVEMMIAHPEDVREPG